LYIYEYITILTAMLYVRVGILKGSDILYSDIL